MRGRLGRDRMVVGFAIYMLFEIFKIKVRLYVRVAQISFSI
jgi:hypothetical protein